MNDRVDYVCTRAEHQASEPKDALTMHDDSWAYCSGGGSGPHDWRSTPMGGMSLDDAKRLVEQHRPARSTQSVNAPTDNLI
jgi:hypothetical protein